MVRPGGEDPDDHDDPEGRTMLGRKTFTAEEIDHARTAVRAEVAALRAHDDPALANALLLALDRRFVHRIRATSGKDTNPVTEVELLAESLLEHGGVMTPNKVIKYDPARAVLGLAPGDTIALDAASLERLADAFLAELAVRFGEVAPV
ncbi:hypothetical protein [Actinomycetospora aeridis]|uniref:Uncharacterized protein n=1 Tax=Actinomycetospora aeridis TaxID=3129231 RepID=A0ABU8ND94_9PSEU